ncbi:MAG: tetraacyldisaccharide 4'-kinase [Acidobacteria bacterium RIFCSPLOWO2_02_FULL_68_18]|nr:MAG: tetraacyldisaccharide 4'-kinase [Acidobacteria bacterium RIFCSPLOWO2_02_FULL_68_18]OFW48152.1 MAG: tetraacyldisaccharide 4'-kinase [Acidobacteria bacterium RIFCSPLOWO2_12_FULL_68_19]
MLAGLYGRAAAFRRAWYGRRPDRVRRLDRPVVSVGNLVAGGSGKTPLVATLARLLRAAGERPAILSRGYGRRERPAGVVVVSDGERLLAGPAKSGDEPYMLACALPGVPVFVAPDRHLAGRLAEQQFACTVHLLDDGFQHLQLARDIDLLVVSRADLDEPLLPAGRLREPLAAARVADALLVPGAEGDVEAVQQRIGVETAFRVQAHAHAPRLLAAPDGTEIAPGSRPVVAVAGIARPARFFAALRAQGWEVARELVFRDHHWFTDRDIAAVERAAFEAGTTLVITTEKDAVRLTEAQVRHEAAPLWAVLPLELVVEPGERFASWLAGRLAAARRRRIEAAA